MQLKQTKKKCKVSITVLSRGLPFFTSHPQNQTTSMKHLTRLAACCSLALLGACNDDNNPFVINKPIQVTSLRFIGEQIVPFGQTYNGTTLGGFSSIDYRADNGSYYIMC